MKNTIIIDGVVYVRADNQNIVPQSVIENVEDMCIQYNGIVYEDDIMVLQAERIEDNETICSVEFTDKTVKPWKEEYLDNENWLIGIVENNPESMDDFKKTFKTEYQQEVFKAFLLKLKAMGWL